MLLNEKILVIEDSIDMRENIIDMLNEYGYSTFEADNGVSGLAIAKEVKPDLIIADIMMPGMDGFELLEALKKDNRTFSIPFIFLSAKAADSDTKRSLKTDADLYITKPFKMNELLSHISDILI